MTHPLNMPHVAGVRCSDLPTPGEWLRALAGNLALIRTWWAVPMVVAHLLIHVADIVAFWRHGQASVLYPVLRGGLTAFLFQFLLQAGLFFCVPLYLSVALGLSAVETGIRILPLSITLLLAAVGVPKPIATLLQRPQR